MRISVAVGTKGLQLRNYKIAFSHFIISLPDTEVSSNKDLLPTSKRIRSWKFSYKDRVSSNYSFGMLFQNWILLPPKSLLILLLSRALLGGLKWRKEIHRRSKNSFKAWTEKVWIFVQSIQNRLLEIFNILLRTSFKINWIYVRS